jgi:hypothetical protein
MKNIGMNGFAQANCESNDISKNDWIGITHVGRIRIRAFWGVL